LTDILTFLLMDKSTFTNEQTLFTPRRSPEDRQKNYITATEKQIQQYIKDGSQGDLDLRDTPITSLPNNLKTVGGNLDLSYTPIQSLPDNLTVEGSLFLDGCENLKKLPNNLTVKGDLGLDGCENLKTLPNNLEITFGDLILFNTPIQSLPGDLKMGSFGNILLAGTPLGKKHTKEEIQRMVPGVKGEIEGASEWWQINNQQNEQTLFTPRRSPEERQKNHLIAIQKQIQQYIKDGSKGDLNLENAPIESLPNNLTMVGGNLNLRDCNNLKSLPDNLTVRESLYLNRASIKSLPDNLTVKDDLHIMDTYIESLPNNLKVGKDLALDGCIHLKSLSDDLKLSLYSDISLGNCLKLEYLPDNLNIRDLHLNNCISLKTFPKNLTVRNIILQNTYFSKTYTKWEIKKMIEESGGSVSGVYL
jgi:hypothetical protein